MKRVLFAAALLTLSACETSPRLNVSPPYRPAEPEVRAPPPQVETPAPVADTCGARPLQSLIGHPRTEIPVPIRPQNQRVVCSTCPMTMDFSAERLNFLFDAKTGLITEIRCG